MALRPSGEWGGRVLRRMDALGRTWAPGETLSAEVAMQIAPRNRAALGQDGSGKVLWFNPPADAEHPQPAAGAQRYKVNAGPGRFLVVEGVPVTPEPVDKETADRLVEAAARPQN